MHSGADPVAIVWLAQEQADVPAGWQGTHEARTEERRPSPKRLRESRLRRWTAGRALAIHLGLPPGVESLERIEIRHEPGGAPAAFVDGRAAGLAISLTDREGRAVCALAPARVALGCDLELVEPRTESFVADYLTAAEQGLVAGAPAAERHLLANLVWSAKEAALKALRTGLRRDTRSVEVSFPAGEESGGWRPLRAAVAEGGLGGWWRRDGDFVLTVVADAPSGPPAPLAGR